MASKTQIAYGNPTVYHRHIQEQASILDYLFSKFQTHSFPSNDSDAVRVELNDIANCIKKIQEPEHQKILENYIIFDKNLLQGICNLFKTKELDVQQLCENIQKDVFPLVIKLKYFYNRPRPYQLANAYSLKLFPFDSKSSNSPSYPSNQTLTAGVILKVIQSKHPEHFEMCNHVFETIMYSRIYLGHNYQSDNDFSIEIIDAILTSPKFLSKYNL